MIPQLREKVISFTTCELFNNNNNINMDARHNSVSRPNKRKALVRLPSDDEIAAASSSRSSRSRSRSPRGTPARPNHSAAKRRRSRLSQVLDPEAEMNPDGEAPPAGYVFSPVKLGVWPVPRLDFDSVRNSGSESEMEDEEKPPLGLDLDKMMSTPRRFVMPAGPQRNLFAKLKTPKARIVVKKAKSMSNLKSPIVAGPVQQTPAAPMRMEVVGRVGLRCRAEEERDEAMQVPAAPRRSSLARKLEEAY